ncbi:methyltransferase family protein [Ruminococcus flavefaciens]|uniref:Protein-S-isoprenylcysteine O-methyltransferase Ste14 n=1 Tax=Ruminococcus flavefaciens TaxID=1265 RepID=A0A1M7HZS1_RUMFL|nr:isoprenylcysteine carboxylmethyltransferase family protein [Ruminococcus flavefaciens]SHM33823.1 Protein-S-isoprenylcysteine O-methyltransferase Ste14 [Ruminococcus flavefaciens]
MKKELIINGFIKLISGFIILMLLIFLSAGTLRFLNGWLFIGLLFIPMLIMGIVLLIKNPALLEKRLNGKEKESKQKGVVALSGIMFLAGFVVAGLNYRFDWWTLPDWCVIAASVVFLLSYVMYAEVLRENTYLSRTIEVQEKQKVIDTGLYGIVRHPMYSETILMFLAIPLILGSLIALFIFLAYPLAIALRISNEEEVLEKGLAGYSEYKKKVKYRIIPFIW